MSCPARFATCSRTPSATLRATDRCPCMRGSRVNWRTCPWPTDAGASRRTISTGCSTWPSGASPPGPRGPTPGRGSALPSPAGSSRRTTGTSRCATTDRAVGSPSGSRWTGQPETVSRPRLSARPTVSGACWPRPHPAHRHPPDEREQPDRQHVPQRHHHGGDHPDEAVEGVVPGPGDRRALLGSGLDEPGLGHPHRDGGEIALVVQHAELALDLLDVELHLLELLLHADAVADRGGLRHQPEEHVLLRLPVPQPGLEVAELGGHVLARHPLLPHRDQPLDVTERALELIRRNPDHERPGMVLPRCRRG